MAPTAQMEPETLPSQGDSPYWAKQPGQSSATQPLSELGGETCRLFHEGVVGMNGSVVTKHSEIPRGKAEEGWQASEQQRPAGELPAGVHTFRQCSGTREKRPPLVAQTSLRGSRFQRAWIRNRSSVLGVPWVLPPFDHSQ